LRVGTQIVSDTGVAGTAMKKPAWQDDDTFAQMRSDVSVGACLYCWGKLHSVCCAQTRSDRMVGGTISYCVPLHFVSALHTVSEVSVAQVTKYCSGVHVLTSPHCRSEVAVSGAASYWGAYVFEVVAERRPAVQILNAWEAAFV